MSSMPTLVTAGLQLRPWALEDASALLAILQEPGLLEFFPPAPPPTLERVKRYLAHQLDHWQRFGYGHWAVVTGEDQQVAGWAGLEYLPELQQTEVAYLLTRRVHGRGLATEAARAALQYGRQVCRLPVVIGLVHPANCASIRVLEKCGLGLADRLQLWGLELLRYTTTGQEG